MESQPDLFEWAENRPSAEIINAVPLIARRIWFRRFWPKPQQPCIEPIYFNEQKRGAA